MQWGVKVGLSTPGFCGSRDLRAKSSHRTVLCSPGSFMGTSTPGPSRGGSREMRQDERLVRVPIGSGGRNCGGNARPGCRIPWRPRSIREGPGRGQDAQEPRLLVRAQGVRGRQRADRPAREPRTTISRLLTWSNALRSHCGSRCSRGERSKRVEAAPRDAENLKTTSVRVGPRSENERPAVLSRESPSPLPIARRFYPRLRRRSE